MNYFLKHTSSSGKHNGRLLFSKIHVHFKLFTKAFQLELNDVRITFQLLLDSSELRFHRGEKYS